MWSCLQNRIICKMCNFCGGSSKIFQYEKTGLFANCNGIYVDGNNRLGCVFYHFRVELLGEAEDTWERTAEDMENGLGSAIRKLYKGRRGEKIYAKYKTKRGKSKR